MEQKKSLNLFQVKKKVPTTTFRLNTQFRMFCKIKHFHHGITSSFKLCRAILLKIASWTFFSVPTIPTLLQFKVRLRIKPVELTPIERIVQFNFMFRIA